MPTAVAPGAPAAPPPAAAPARPAGRGEGGLKDGRWHLEPAKNQPADGSRPYGRADGKAREAGSQAGAEAPAVAGGVGVTKIATQRADRVEALRRYYSGLALLDRGDHTTALAEFVLAKSAAPEMVVIDEAIRKAKAGIDGAAK